MDCFSLGGLVEMKIHYRKPTLLELMNDAICNNASGSEKLIQHFELTPDELNSWYSYFDRTTKKDNTVDYSYKGIPIKVKE
jgi:hypothetical protein